MASSGLPSYDLEAIAKCFRPKLEELSKVFKLKEGILGIAFFGPSFSGKLPIFAVFAKGPKSSSAAALESSSAAVYDLERFHPVITVLQQNSVEPDVWLQKEAIKASENTHQDIWNPVEYLFGGAGHVPENIRIWRTWLANNQSSALYYEPKDQKSQSNGWDAMTLLRRWAIEDFKGCIKSLEELEDDTRNAFNGCFPD